MALDVSSLCYFYFSTFGASMRNMLRPSILGFVSTVATSAQASEKRSNTRCPISLCVIARPLKRIEAFTLSPFSRNLIALRSFVLKSCSSIVGLNRTSFKLMIF
ncbi:hypothetical protein C883_3438 [Bacillus stratosphericus LAMA 585]|nr:hypothetical protein C883_3438 [Bacillus stratosphericus LAMA 585]